MTELAWRIWHRLRWGHPFYTTRTGSVRPSQPVLSLLPRRPGGDPVTLTDIEREILSRVARGAIAAVLHEIEGEPQ